MKRASDGPKLISSFVDRVRNFFIPSSGAILAITGIAKIWAAFGRNGVLILDDPVFHIKFSHLMFGVGLIELGVATACFILKQRASTCVLLGWLAANFLIYRIALWKIGWHKPCSCLGNLTDALHVSPQIAETIMRIIFFYLLIGSYGILACQLLEKRRAS